MISKEALLRKAEEVVLNCDVYYDWSRESGLLATILGLVWYLAEAALNYVEPLQPPSIHPPTIEAGRAAVIRA